MAAVTAGGAAAKAGIQAGDIIVSVAGQPTGSITALQSVLAAQKPGDRVPVVRPGEFGGCYVCELLVSLADSSAL